MLLRFHNQPQNPALTAAFLSSNRRILRALSLSVGDRSGFRSFKPSSPVKLLSNFLQGGTSTPSSPTKLQKPAAGNVQSMQPPTSLPIRSPSKKKVEEAPSQPTHKITVVGSTDPSCPVDPLQKLEATFVAFVNTLHERRGNVLGKVLRGRTVADETTVNFVYNGLGKLSIYLSRK
jgi:hypothetical protein